MIEKLLNRIEARVGRYRGIRNFCPNAFII